MADQSGTLGLNLWAAHNSQSVTNGSVDDNSFVRSFLVVGCREDVSAAALLQYCCTLAVDFERCQVWG